MLQTPPRRCFSSARDLLQPLPLSVGFIEQGLLSEIAWILLMLAQWLQRRPQKFKTEPHGTGPAHHFAPELTVIN